MSLAVRVIPCLDVDAGRVVKGVNFANLRDAGDPVELARRYGQQGADELTFLDVTASSADRATTYDVVTRTAEEVFIPLTVGGGVRAVEHWRTILANAQMHVVRGQVSFSTMLEVEQREDGDVFAPAERRTKELGNVLRQLTRLTDATASLRS